MIVRYSKVVPSHCGLMFLKKRCVSAGLAVASLSAPIFLGITSVAHAEDREKTPFYGVLGIGVHSPEHEKGDTTYFGNKYEFSSEIDGGSATTIGLGYFVNDNWRMQFTYGRVTGEMDKADVNGTTFTINDADYEMHSFNLTAYRDFELKNSKFVPYVGAGFGLGFTNMSDYSVTVDGTTLEEEGGVGSSEWLLNVVIGTSYPLNESLDLYSEIGLIHKPHHSANNLDYDPWQTIGFVAGTRFTF